MYFFLSLFMSGFVISFFRYVVLYVCVCLFISFVIYFVRSYLLRHFFLWLCVCRYYVISSFRYVGIPSFRSCCLSLVISLVCVLYFVMCVLLCFVFRHCLLSLVLHVFRYVFLSVVRSFSM